MNLRPKLDQIVVAFSVLGLSLPVFVRISSPLVLHQNGFINALLNATVAAGLTFWVIALQDSYRSRCEVKLVEFQRGETCLADIIGTKKSILVTHFSDQAPIDVYIQLLLRKMDADVQLCRYLPKDIGDDTKKWLKHFEDAPNYTQHTTQFKDMPFDIFVFDQRKVYLLFPGDAATASFTEGILLESEEIALMFSTALRRLNTPRQLSDKDQATATTLAFGARNT